MPRSPRIQFAGAIYHVVTRGDGRQKLFYDPGHYERFTIGLEQEVQRCGWIVLAYCWMPNHIHALIQTLQPNLATGMQHWLSGYANWYAKRNRRRGHHYQGRETKVREPNALDATYFLALLDKPDSGTRNLFLDAALAWNIQQGHFTCYFAAAFTSIPILAISTCRSSHTWRLAGGFRNK